MYVLLSMLVFKAFQAHHMVWRHWTDFLASLQIQRFNFQVTYLVFSSQGWEKTSNDINDQFKPQTTGRNRIPEEKQVVQN